MKKLSIILMTVLVISMLVAMPALAAESMKSGWYVVTGNQVNLRDAPKGGQVLCYLNKGDRVRLVRDCSSHEFMVPVTWGDAFGYVSRDYLAPREEPTAASATEAGTAAGSSTSSNSASTSTASPEVYKWPRVNLLGYPIEDVKSYNWGNNTQIGTIPEGQEVIIGKLRRDYYVVWDGEAWVTANSKKIQVTDINVPGEGNIYVVKDNPVDVPVREAPDKTAKVLEYLLPGWYVRLLEETEDGKWSKVAFDEEGTEGYIATSLIRLAETDSVFREK